MKNLNLKPNWRYHFIFIVCTLLNTTAFGQYCEPPYITGTDIGHFIDGVILEDIINTSSGSSTSGITGYSDFTDLSTELISGENYTLKLYNNPTRELAFTAWIDFNQDEVFDYEELLGTLILNKDTFGTISFTTPFTALSGETRLRIRSSPNVVVDTLNPCDLLLYGETEDYTIIFPEANLHDLALAEIIGLENECELGTNAIKVELFNLGSEPANDFSISYQITDPILGLLPVVTEDYEGIEIASSNSIEYTFSTLGDFSNLGEYLIEAWITWDLDEYNFNNIKTKTITSIPTINSFPYYEDFEDGSSGWTSSGLLNSWQLGSPDGMIINGAPPTTPFSENSWVTNLTGNYNSYEDSYVLSPCFNFTSLEQPYVKLDIFWETADNYDGGILEYSLDEGITWEGIGDYKTGENWYQSGGCFSHGLKPEILEYKAAWEGTRGKWVTAYHDISFLAGESHVMIRMHFASYFFYGIGNDGIAFDNFKIADPLPDDVGVCELTNPAMASASYTSADTVTVKVKNFGINSQTGFTVKYQADGGTIYSGTYTGTLAAGITDDFTFTSTADLNSFETHEICAWTELIGDDDSSNDSTCFELYHMPPITGGESYLIYSNSTGAEPFYGTEYADAMNDVYDSAWTLEYFEEMNPLEVFNSNTCFIYMLGSHLHTTEMQYFLDDNPDLAEAWVEAGGSLIINASSNELNNPDTLHLGFNNTDIYFMRVTNEVNALDVTHPIFTGPFIPLATEYTGYTDISYGYLIGEGFNPLMEDSNIPGSYVMGEQDWGLGHILFAVLNSPDHWDYSYMGGENMHRNMLEYMKECYVVFCNPIPPSDIYADNITATTATIHWTIAPGTSATRGVLWELSSGDIRKWISYDEDNYIISGALSPSTTYGVRLKSGCLDGEIWTPGDYSDWYYFTTDPLREGEFAQSVSFYPNPNKGNFRIQLNGYESGEAQVIILNAVGQVMYDANISIDANASVHDISLNLAAGTYIVKVINGSEIVTNTIIVE